MLFRSRSGQAGDPDGAGITLRAGRPDRALAALRPGRPGCPDRSDRSCRPRRPHRAGRSHWPDRSRRSCGANRPDRPCRPRRSGRPGRAGNAPGLSLRPAPDRCVHVLRVRFTSSWARIRSVPLRRALRPAAGPAARGARPGWARASTLGCERDASRGREQRCRDRKGSHQAQVHRQLPPRNVLSVLNTEQPRAAQVSARVCHTRTDPRWGFHPSACPDAGSERPGPCPWREPAGAGLAEGRA